MDGPETWRATFIAKIGSETEYHMDLWMPGNAKRRVFAVDAPVNHAGRDSLPPEFSQIPMPAILARQQGNAWQQPFIAVYEPYRGDEGAKIQNVRMAKLADETATVAACVIEGTTESGFQMVVLQDDQPAQLRKIENYDFQGSFGIVTSRENSIAELYLGNGKKLGDSQAFLTVKEVTPANASLLRQGDVWIYSASAPINAGLAFSVPENISASNAWSLWLQDAAGRRKIESADIQPGQSSSGQNVLLVKCELPVALNARLSVQPS